MARSSQRTGWQYQGPTSENILLKPDLRRFVVKVEVPVDSAEEELLDNSTSFEEQSQYGQSSSNATNGLAENDGTSPKSPRTLLLNPCTVLRELPSRQISFSQCDLSAEGSPKSHQYRRQKMATMSSHARKAMMTRPRNDVNANEVVVSMLSNPNMNQAGLEADHIRMETIRDLNCSLTMKRRMKRRIGHEMVNKRKPSVIQSPTLMFRLTQVFYHLKMWTRQTWTKVDMWRSQLMHIEGKYGSATTYYFRFLRFLIYLNLVTFILTASFVITPQLLLRFFGQYTNESFTTERGHTPLTTTTQMTNLFKGSQFHHVNTYSLLEVSHDNQTIAFQWTDLLTGAGFLSTTELYYGTYVNFPVSINGHDYYNLALAYLLVTIICLLFCLLMLANRVAKAYKQHIVVNSGFGVHIYCNLVFSSWDFKIRSNKAAKVKSTGIRQEFEVKIAQLRNEANPLNSREQFKKYSRHLFIHLVVLAILAGTAALIWFLLQNNSLKTGIPVLDDMMVPLVITVLLIVVPFTFTLLISWENYINETTAIYVNMIRMMLLLVTVIGVLCYFWFRTNAHEDTSTSVNNCWETRLGEEIYKLLMVDLVIVNPVAFVATFIRRYLLYQILGFPEFNMAWNTWNLIYSQMLGWLGALYMPPVSALVMLKLIITYYVKQVHIRLNCVPPARPWSASLTKTIFLSLAFIGLLAMMVPVGYSIFAMRPSPVCGPFNATDDIFSVFVIVLQTFSMVDSVFAFILNLFSMPGFVAAILVILCAVAFQAKSYANSTKQLRERLRRQVILEGNDKVFLLNMLDGATKALESMRTNRNNGVTMGRRIFRFPSVARDKRTNPSKEDKHLIVASVVEASPSNMLGVMNSQDFGSSSTEQSFITCEPSSPINSMDNTPNKNVKEMTASYKTTAI